jgi:nucleotide-binding universal stress UspA family protein
MFDKIVFAVDGSEYAKKGIPVVVDLATKSHSEVLVVHVHDKGLVSRETVDIESLPEACAQ